MLRLSWQHFQASYWTTERLRLEARIQSRSDPDWLANWLYDHLRHKLSVSLFVLEPLSPGKPGDPLGTPKASLLYTTVPGNQPGHKVELRLASPEVTAAGQLVLAAEGHLRDRLHPQEKLDFEPIRFEFKKGFGNQTILTIRVINFFELVVPFLEQILLAIADRWPEALELLEVTTQRSDQFLAIEDDGYREWTELAERMKNDLKAHRLSVAQPSVLSTLAEQSENPGNEIVWQPRSAGRKPDPEYDRAFQLMADGASENEAFDWWCEEKAIESPDIFDRNRFEAAMRRRKNKLPKK